MFISSLSLSLFVSLKRSSHKSLTFAFAFNLVRNIMNELLRWASNYVQEFEHAPAITEQYCAEFELPYEEMDELGRKVKAPTGVNKHETFYCCVQVYRIIMKKKKKKICKE